MARRIRDFDWSATPLGPIADWSERLKLAVEFMLASPLVSTLACGPQRLLLYNDAAARHFGDHHPAALGRPLPDTFPEGWATVAPFYARAFDGETVKVGGQPLDTRGEGVATDVFDALLTPVREADGSVAHVHMTGAEVGGRTRIEAALRASEEKYRTLFENMGQGYALGEVIRDAQGRAVDLRYLELNPAFERLSGIPVAQAQGRTVREVYGAVEPEWFEVAERVARLKTPERVEYEIAAIGRWFQTHFYPAEGDRYLGLYEDVTERKRAEAALRESEKRQAFLLKLTDALRPLDNPVTAQEVAARLLGTELRVDRCYYAEFDWPRDVLVINQEYVGSASFSVIGEHPISLFQDLLQFSHKGEPLVCDDIAAHPIFKSEVAAYRERGTDGFILIPLIKLGIMAACMCVTMTVPRAWSPAEVELVREVADRTWDASQRIRAEGALRDSEARFRQFAVASASALWIRDAATLHMEYVSPAIAGIYGVEPAAFLDGVELWAASILPEDRDLALTHLEKARQGEAVVHEFRIQRTSDNAFRWIRNTDFPLYDQQGRVQRIGGIAEDVTEVKLASEHADVLLHELQHRVRNIMGMIRSMANRSEPGAVSVSEYRTLLEGRLLALARVQALLTREANAGGSLRDVIESEVAAQAHHGGQYALTGPDIQLSPKAVEVLTLAFHELATNALKYGALSVAEGRLTVDWALVDRKGRPWLSLDWIEAGAPPREPVARRGFGSELIEARIPYELGGRGRITIGSDGARCHLEFPLTAGESILETDAPQPATIFGGTLDMTGAPDLTGRMVLVVEDDYYMAHDTAAALRGAGAAVLGPCPNVDATRELLDAQTPTHAVLDLNLGGGGPQFEIAHLLRARGVPFVFLTGYDPDVIPEDLADIVRLQKPLPFRAIVEAVSRLRPPAKAPGSGHS